jgi:hypothetical protein
MVTRLFETMGNVMLKSVDLPKNTSVSCPAPPSIWSLPNPEEMNSGTHHKLALKRVETCGSQAKARDGQGCDHVFL